MKQILSYIRSFYKEGFNGQYFIFILLMLSVLLYMNYVHQLNIRIDNNSGSFATGWALYYALYFIPFGLGFFLQLLFFPSCKYYSNKWFWLILFLAPAIFAFRVNISAGNFLQHFTGNADDLNWAKHCLNLVLRASVVIGAVLVLWLIKDKKNQPFYGVQKTGTIRPYLLMLLIMVPLIAAASTQKDFLHTYPKVKFLIHASTPQSVWHYIGYELCYSFDFVSIEVFFRGFLVLSLLRICGPHCIIPIACFYCSIHLGKPAGEAISSFWGGLLLGIISYHTRSIRGGLLVHLGIAWMMEAGGLIGSMLLHH